MWFLRCSEWLLTGCYVLVRVYLCGCWGVLSGCWFVVMWLLGCSRWLPGRCHVVSKVFFVVVGVMLWSPLRCYVVLSGCCVLLCGHLGFLCSCHMVSKVLFALGGCQSVAIWFLMCTKVWLLVWFYVVFRALSFHNKNAVLICESY